MAARSNQDHGRFNVTPSGLTPRQTGGQPHAVSSAALGFPPQAWTVCSERITACATPTRLGRTESSSNRFSGPKGVQGNSSVSALRPTGHRGARTQANAARLAAVTGAPCYVIEGGIDAWRRDGLEVRADRRQPLELMRQVQLAAGGLVLLGVVLGFLLGPGFFILSAFVGAGLMLAGATGWCGMARLLRHMPWNRQMAA